MLESILKIIVTAIVLITIMLFYTLHRNGAHISQPPGVMKRLAIFLSVNSASTTDDPYFSELRTPMFAMNAEDLYQSVLSSGSAIGWSIVANDRDKYNVSFIVRSPVFLFEDDVFVQINMIDVNRSSLYIQSKSRMGKADLAANSSHIQKLVHHLKTHK